MVKRVNVRHFPLVLKEVMCPNLTVVITPQDLCSTGSRATAVGEMNGVSILLMCGHNDLDLMKVNAYGRI